MEFKFTPENIDRINKEIAKYPVKKPAVMATLIHCTGTKWLHLK